MPWEAERVATMRSLGGNTVERCRAEAYGREVRVRLHRR